LCEQKKFEKKTKENKLTYQGGAGAKLLGALLHQDPAKRFKVEWMVKSSPEFNEEIYNYLKITNEDLEVYHKELNEVIVKKE